MKNFLLSLAVLALVAGGMCWPSFDNPISWGRRFAIDRSQDQAALAAVAIHDTDPAIRQAAVDKVTDQAVLAKLMLDANDRDIRQAAEDKVTNQTVLAKLMLDANDRDLRLRMVERIMDPVELASVATSDLDVEVRRAAAAKVTDQAVLAKLLMEERDKANRLLLIGRITDQATMAAVAVRDRDVEVRQAAAAKMTNQGDVAKVMLEGKDRDLRSATVGSLTNQTALAVVAANDPDAEIRRGAVVHLPLTAQDDQIRLERLSRLVDNLNVAAVAKTLAHQLDLERLLDGLPDAAAQVQAALTDANPEIRRGAAARVTDIAGLAKIADATNDWGVARTILTKLTPAPAPEVLKKWGMTNVAEMEHDVDLGLATKLHLLWVPPTPRNGFLMGDIKDKTEHRVLLTRGFFLGATDVTQEQWRTVMGSTPSAFRGDNLPVENISWDQAKSFCEKLSQQERTAGHLATGWSYTLPTEAQWEYACRAGTTGDSAGDLDAMAWYDQNSGGKTHPVGTKQPNAWGFYDMNGNVWQWCLDWEAPYPSTNVTNPTGPLSGKSRIFRGGCWGFTASYCRPAFRFDYYPGIPLANIGFRLALSVSP